MSTDASPAGALAKAVRSNDTRAVARVLDQHPELKVHLDDALPDDAFGATPLLSAVHRDNRELVDLLLGAGANINVRSHWWAGGFGVLDHDGSLAPYLIERGATVDAFAAARLGLLDRLAALITADPGVVHARGGDGQTPLHFARSVETARFLLEHGADIDARDIDHESTPAQWMIRDRQDVARFLVSRGCHTDILMAAALGDSGRVTRYLDDDPATLRTTVSDEYFPRKNPRSAGTIYNWTLGTGKTAHVIAREFRHEDIYRLLLERTPAPLRLAVSCEVGDEESVKALLGADPSLPQKLTPAELRKLPDAARDEQLTAVRLMLDAGWPPDVRGQHGATALHWAGFHGDVALTRELLRARPPLEITDPEFNGTPLSWAIYGSVHGWRAKTGDYPGTVQALLEAGATPPPVAADFPLSEALRDLLRRRVNGASGASGGAEPTP